MFYANHRLLSAKERHTCNATRNGDWILHRCTICDYELWDNYRTGELKVFNAKPHVNHSGSYVAAEIEQFNEIPN
jgi:hypothetical protein